MQIPAKAAQQLAIDLQMDLYSGMSHFFRLMCAIIFQLLVHFCRVYTLMELLAVNVSLAYWFWT